VEEIARFADVINTTRENIGARRLATVVQVVVEEISFLAHR
jgi:ATP-dependent protease HslVU (ClpYQ) ATPase subunit